MENVNETFHFGTPRLVMLGERFKSLAGIIKGTGFHAKISDRVPNMANIGANVA